MGAIAYPRGRAFPDPHRLETNGSGTTVVLTATQTGCSRTLVVGKVQRRQLIPLRATPNGAAGPGRRAAPPHHNYPRR